MPGDNGQQVELPQRFEHAVNKTNAALFKAAGTTLLVVTIGTFFALPLFSIEIEMPWHYVIVVPIFIAIVLLSKAGHAKSIGHVTVDEAGVIIERGDNAVEIEWSDLGWAEYQQSAAGEYLLFYDRDMKIVERVPKTIDRFEALCKLVQARFEERPVDEVADALDLGIKAYSRKQLWFGGVLTVLGLALLVLGWVMPNELPRLNKYGEYDWAEIVELYRFGEEGVPRLSYQLGIGDEYGPVEDVHMEEEAWLDLKKRFDNEGDRYVEVVYLPDDLSVSFADGQVMPTTHYSPIFVYLKAGFALLVGLSMLVAAYKNRNGRERIVDHLNEQRG
ncbi:MAG: hypothetical protein AAGB26_03935 [Planctomycetota bacterium]